MTKYMKAFVYAALFYLGVATIFGILNGTTDIGYIGSFAHTHFNLLGFMSMIVFGIGYFILPRFNGTLLRFENWVPIHFYLGNISLIGMVIFRGLQVETGDNLYSLLFIISATIQVISIFMFITNIWITLSPKKITVKQSVEEQQREANFKIDESTMPNMSVTPQTKISDLVDRLPSLQNVLIECGLLALQMPGHIDKVRQMGITIEMAAKNHSLNLDNLILKVEEELHKNGFTTKPDLNSYKPEHSYSSEEINLSLLIGDVLKQYPESKDTFKKYFGDGCFDCPGQEYESIDMACRMHNVDPEQFIKELKNSLV